MAQLLNAGWVGNLQQATVEVFPADVLNLLSGYSPLLANAGPTRLLVILSVIAITRFGTKPFTQSVNDSAAIAIVYNGPSLFPAVALDLNTLIVAPKAPGQDVIRVGTVGFPIGDWQNALYSTTANLSEVLGRDIVLANLSNPGGGAAYKSDYINGDGGFLLHFIYTTLDLAQ